MRCTWVSTTTPSALPNQEPRTTLAVLRAAPGTVSRRSMSSGTSPPNSFTMALRCPDDRLRLVAEETGGADIRLELFRLQRGEVLRRGIFLEQLRRHHVHANVGALRGENGGDQEFPGIVVMQRALHIRIALVETLKNLVYTVGSDRVIALGGGAARLSLASFAGLGLASFRQFLRPTLSLRDKGGAPTLCLTALLVWRPALEGWRGICPRGIGLIAPFRRLQWKRDRYKFRLEGTPSCRAGRNVLLSAEMPAHPITLEGHSVLHQMFRFRWAEWNKLGEGERLGILKEASQALCADGREAARRRCSPCSDTRAT